MEDGFHISLLTGSIGHFLNIFLDMWEGEEIIVNQFFGFASADSYTFREPKGGDAIYNTKIGSFGFPSFISCNTIQGFVVDFCCSSGMDIIAILESMNHLLVLTQMGKDTEFYL